MTRAKRADPKVVGFHAFLVKELKALLGKHGLSTSGKNKQELIAELTKANIPVPSSEELAQLIPSEIGSGQNANSAIQARQGRKAHSQERSHYHYAFHLSREMTDDVKG